MSGPERPIDPALFDAATAAATTSTATSTAAGSTPTRCRRSTAPGAPARSSTRGTRRSCAGCSRRRRPQAVPPARPSRWPATTSRRRWTKRPSPPPGRPAGAVSGAHRAAATVGDVRDIVRDLQRTGASPLHSLGIAPDFEDADAYLVYLGQGGLGLPERDYYTRDDEQSVALRAQYVAHVATQLGNLGDAEARRRTPPSASSPSRRGWPSRPTPPRSCATCSSR